VNYEPDIAPVLGHPILKVKTKEEVSLVISDLHLGLEGSLAQKGVILPSQLEQLAGEIKAVVKGVSAGRLVFIGDVKESENKLLHEEWREIPSFFEDMLSLPVDVDVVPGNHDGGLELMLPSGVVFHSARGMLLETARGRPVGLFHGHAWPAPEVISAEFLVVGHNHWAVELRDQMGARVREPVWVVSRTKAGSIASAYLSYSGISLEGEDPVRVFEDRFGVAPVDSTVISMPAFNPLLRGRPVNRRLEKDAPLGPLYKDGVIELGSSDVYALDGTYLGRVAGMPSSLVVGRRRTA